MANFVAKPENTSLKIVSVFERPTPIAAEPFAVSAEYYNEMEELGRKHTKECSEHAATQIRGSFPNAVLDLTSEVIVEAARNGCDDSWK